MTWTINQRKEVKRDLLDAAKQVNNYKGKKHESVRISFPSGERKPFIVTAKKDKERHDEGLYRNALITVWETPIKIIFNNIKYMRKEFNTDKQIQLVLDKIEKFFRRKYYTSR